MRYNAILHPGDTLKGCLRVCRETDAGFEEYNFETNGWEFNVELISIYLGDPEVEEITDGQANEIIDRIRKWKGDES